MNFLEGALVDVAVDNAIAVAVVRMFNSKKITLEQVGKICENSKDLAFNLKFHEVSLLNVDEYILKWYHETFEMTFEERYEMIGNTIRNSLK